MLPAAGARSRGGRYRQGREERGVPVAGAIRGGTGSSRLFREKAPKRGQAPEHPELSS